jgi:hypothetical protein
MLFSGNFVLNNKWLNGGMRFLFYFLKARNQNTYMLKLKNKKAVKKMTALYYSTGV